MSKPDALGQANGDATAAPFDAPAAELGSVFSVRATIPLRLSTLGNRREHHFTRARRVRGEIGAVLRALSEHEPPALPAIVVLVRVGWNALDFDGLVQCMKSPIDALAKWFGVDDRDRRLRWRLAQTTTRETRLTRGRRMIRREAASSLEIAARAWRIDDGDDLLRVLGAPPW